MPYNFLQLCQIAHIIPLLHSLNGHLTEQYIQYNIIYDVCRNPAMTVTAWLKAALMLISQFGVSFALLLYIICQLHVQKLHGSAGSWLIYLSCIHTDKLCALPQWTFPLELPGKNEVGLSNGAIAHTTALSEGRTEELLCAHVPLEPMPAPNILRYPCVP